MTEITGILSLAISLTGQPAGFHATGIKDPGAY